MRTQKKPEKQNETGKHDGCLDRLTHCLTLLSGTRYLLTRPRLCFPLPHAVLPDDGAGGVVVCVEGQTRRSKAFTGT